MSGRLNKSEMIRRLYDTGMTVMEIAKYMGIRYQFAYNVVSYYAMQKELEVQKYVAVGDDRSSSLRVESR